MDDLPAKLPEIQGHLVEAEVRSFMPALPSTISHLADITKPGRPQLPNCVTHYKVVVPAMCDIFWAVLVLILEEYFENVDRFKLVIFANGKPLANVLYAMLSQLELKIEIIILKLTAEHTLFNKQLAFENSKSAICVCSIITVGAPRLNLPCTQAIQIGMPCTNPMELPCRMLTLKAACKSSETQGRFITISTPCELDIPSPVVRKSIHGALNYHIDFTEYANLFRMRFNPVIMEAFIKFAQLKVRQSHWCGLVKQYRKDLRKKGFGMRLLRELHLCGILLGVPLKTMLEGGWQRFKSPGIILKIDRKTAFDQDGVSLQQVELLTGHGQDSKRLEEYTHDEEAHYLPDAIWYFIDVLSKHCGDPEIAVQQAKTRFTHRWPRANNHSDTSTSATTKENDHSCCAAYYTYSRSVNVPCVLVNTNRSEAFMKEIDKKDWPECYHRYRGKLAKVDEDMVNTKRTGEANEEAEERDFPFVRLEETATVPQNMEVGMGSKKQVKQEVLPMSGLIHPKRAVLMARAMAGEMKEKDEEDVKTEPLYKQTGTNAEILQARRTRTARRGTEMIDLRVEDERWNVIDLTMDDD